MNLSKGYNFMIRLLQLFVRHGIICSSNIRFYFPHKFDKLERHRRVWRFLLPGRVRGSCRCPPAGSGAGHPWGSGHEAPGS